MLWLNALTTGLRLLALDPTQRFAAARQMGDSGAGWGALGQPTVWGPLLVAPLLAVLLVWAWRRFNGRRAVRTAFGQTADRLDLTSSERAVLMRVADMAEPTAPNSLRTLAMAFDEGSQRLLASRTVSRLDAKGRGRVEAVVTALRAKLGRAASTGVAAVGLVAKNRVRLVVPGAGREGAATILGAAGREITLHLDFELPLGPGDSCFLRWIHAQQHWGLKASVTRAEKTTVVVWLVDKPERSHLRRFVRIPARRRARVARFTFGHDGPVSEMPAFVEAVVTEIGGPGLRLETALPTTVGERVLVMVERGDGRSLRGSGLVRRYTPRGGRPAEVAVELTGLTEQEVAVLVRETHDEARDAAAQDEASDQEQRQEEPAGASAG